MQNENSKVVKSRNISTLDFYEAVQVEYIQADLRRKIYPKLKDKAYWGRVREGKRETIEKLAEKNRLPSIFTDQAMLRAFEKKVYRDQSFPAFTYRNDTHRMEQEFYDFLYYYDLGAEVRIDQEGGVLVGKISREFTPFKDSMVTVKVNGTEQNFNIKQVTRIL